MGVCWAQFDSYWGATLSASTTLTVIDWSDKFDKKGQSMQLLYILVATQASPSDWRDTLATQSATVHGKPVEDEIVLLRFESYN